MASLPTAAKVRLVTLLAQFTGPSEAARIVSEEHGVALNKQQAWKYDPTRSGCQTSPRLRQLFAEMRERWLNDLAVIPISHQAHRLRMLDRLATKLERQGDYGGALKAIEQAAKETGGLFTNQRKAVVEGSVNIVHRDPQEARSQLAALLAAHIDRYEALPAPEAVSGA